MNKEYFLRELEYLLQDVTEEEREEALQYYRDYFDEAGPERETEILAHIGSPEKVAAELKSSLAGEDESGEYTERGYYDERFDEFHKVPDQYAEIVRYGDTEKKDKKKNKNKKEDKEDEKRRNGLLFVLLFVFFGLPLAGSIISAGFSVIAAIAGGLFGIFGGLLGLIAGGFAATIGLFCGGVVMIIKGALNLVTPPIGLMGICLGFFMLAGAMLIAVLTRWGCVTAAPGLLRFSVGLVRRCCRWVTGTVRRIFSRGGDSR
ncbi:MAG: DUF1700 domain-containing protein [Lachnospiraceae bacterium]|nr:DUF1700 domain-containing protein [Lachnospiraceae bacterium]